MEKPTSWVYFLRSGEAGPIKIGYTGTTPNARLSALQTGNPEPLRLIGAVPGTMADESRLHDRFASVRLQGEWFRPVPELLNFIEGALFGCRETPGSYDDIVNADGDSREDIAEFCHVWQALRRVDSLSIAAGCAAGHGAKLDAQEVAELSAHCTTLQETAFEPDLLALFGKDRVERAIREAETLLAGQPLTIGFTEDQIAFLLSFAEMREWRRSTDKMLNGAPAAALPRHPALASVWLTGIEYLNAFWGQMKGFEGIERVKRAAYRVVMGEPCDQSVDELALMLSALNQKENTPPEYLIPAWLRERVEKKEQCQESKESN